jgi:hypothetical protein
LSQLGVPHTQNFEIPFKNSGVKKSWNQFWNFQKMLDRSKFFLKKRKKNCLSPSGYKLESWNFAWTCFAKLNIKLHTQIWNFSEFTLEFSWKIFEFSSKMVKNLSGYKLESWNACPCIIRLSIKLRTQVWNFLEFAEEFSWKILKFSSKMVKKLESWNFVWTCFAR